MQALESYSSYLEPSFIEINLPPTSPSASIPPTFDLSPKYVALLDKEFHRVYEEYAKRVSTVKTLCENIIHLWAELGTPQIQTDAKILEYHKESPEKLGLHQDDINKLKAKQNKLLEEKKRREDQLRSLSTTVETLWNKLRVEDIHRKKFLNSNRGYGIRQINEFEDELARLNELKRQNLHLFVDDARFKLQELWNSLFFSEEEMLQFTPAFSEVYSDALLEAYEQEIEKLELLREQRAPILSLIEKHRGLVKDRDDLQISSQDVSRLLGRGQKGEKRDPSRLLREEKMRKRISKELPKICVELRRVLEKWENEYGRPFLVYGERYLDLLEDIKLNAGPRSKTPAGASTSLSRSQKIAPSAPQNSNLKAPTPAPIRNDMKTPVTSLSLKRITAPSAQTAKSPSKCHARAPLSMLYTDDVSHQHKLKSSLMNGFSKSKIEFSNQLSPPKIRDITIPPFISNSDFKRENTASSGSVRRVTPDDMFYDSKKLGESNLSQLSSNYEFQSSVRPCERGIHMNFLTSRHPSTTSIMTTSSSENWQTIEDDSETEKVTADIYMTESQTHGKRFSNENDPHSSQTKKQKGMIPLTTSRQGYIDVSSQSS